MGIRKQLEKWRMKLSCDYRIKPLSVGSCVNYMNRMIEGVKLIYWIGGICFQQSSMLNEFLELNAVVFPLFLSDHLYQYSVCFDHIHIDDEGIFVDHSERFKNRLYL